MERQNARWLAGSGPKWLLIGVGVLVVVTILAYWPARHGGFVWDDDFNIAQNRLVQSEDGLSRIWFTTESRDYYPLTLSVFWLQWHLWGANVVGFHAVNLALHMVNALLLWLVLARLGVKWSWLASLLFAVHPVNVPSVAWMSELKNLLAMLFGLICLFFHNEHARTGRWRLYGAALVAFLLALLSKSAIVMLPVVLLGTVWWQRGTLRRRDWLGSVPFFALSAVLGLVTVWFQKHRALEGATIMHSGLWERWGAAGWAVWFYLSKALVPVNLSLVYEPWNLNAALRLGFLPLGALAAGTWFLARTRQSWGRPMLVGLGCYVVMLVPVLGFIEQGYYSYSLVADHWQYFSLPAICALVVGGVAAHTRRGVLVWAGAAVLVVVFCQQTYARSRAFVSDEEVWRDTVKRSPRAWVAHLNLANDLARRGEQAAAIPYYLRALEIQPKSEQAHYNLALALAQQGRLKEATTHLTIACQIRTIDASWLQKLGTLLARQGEFDQAAVYLADAARLNPQSAETHYNLGIALAQLGKWTEAEAQYTDALWLTPNDGEVHYALARALLRQSKTVPALAHYREGVRLAPQSAQAASTLHEIQAQGLNP